MALLLAAVLLEVAAWHGRWYACVETSDRILIGQARGNANIRNYVGQNVAVRHDDRSVWIKLPNGKHMRLRQDYLTPAFAPQSRCEKVVDAAIVRHNSPPPAGLRTREPNQPPIRAEER